MVRSYASKGVFDLVATPPRSSRSSKALLIQAKYSRRGKSYITVEEKIRLGKAAARYKAHCCTVTNIPRSKRLIWKLVSPYYYGKYN